MGGPTYKDKKLPDLTLDISKKLDKAIVYGLKTEAASFPFNRIGNYGVWNPAYAFDRNGVFGKNEWENESVWTISSYNQTLKKYTSEKVHESIILHLNGCLERSKIEPTKNPSQGIPRYEDGRIM